MALYILNDPNIQMYIPLKTQYEISMIKALNRKRIPTKTLRQTTDTDFMTEDPQAVLLIPELNTCLTELILFCNKNNIPVIVLHSANTLVPFLTPHYSEITLVDPDKLKEEGKTLSDVADTSAYDQILFMYDCDQFADETNFDLLK